MSRGAPSRGNVLRSRRRPWPSSRRAATRRTLLRTSPLCARIIKRNRVIARPRILARSGSPPAPTFNLRTCPFAQLYFVLSVIGLRLQLPRGCAAVAPYSTPNSPRTTEFRAVPVPWIVIDDVRTAAEREREKGDDTGDGGRVPLSRVNKFGSVGRIPGLEEPARDTTARNVTGSGAVSIRDVRANRGPGPRLHSRASVRHQSSRSSDRFDRQGRGRSVDSRREPIVVPICRRFRPMDERRSAIKNATSSLRPCSSRNDLSRRRCSNKMRSRKFGGGYPAPPITSRGAKCDELCN